MIKETLLPDTDMPPFRYRPRLCKFPLQHSNPLSRNKIEPACNKQMDMVRHDHETPHCNVEVLMRALRKLNKS